MNEQIINDIRQIIKDFNAALTEYLPPLRREVNELIASETKDTNRIEHCLDSLLSIANHGIGTDLFVQLLDYYKTIDEEGARFYWDEFDQNDIETE